MQNNKNMPQDFYSKLEKILKQDSRFVDQEGDLLKSNVIDAAYKADKKLVELLLSGKDFKAKFFSKVKDVLVFNINDFVAYIQDKNFLADSYTKYRNKIGLNIDGKFLNERKETALVWPFKDCVLEGGMTKEDEKRKEIFFNEILAQDEIDKLLTPKVLTNWKKYSQKGEEKVKDLKRDENGTIRENLIIKGNNLLALHSLKQQFQNKIKLIYIDPPYNTGNDSFGYNDNFNHSTWLTFMKNRLEVARELLRDDGVIFVNIDEGEHAYLKVLMDDIFDRDSFICNFLWKKKGTSTNVQGVQVSQQCDFILCYGKTSKARIKTRIKTVQDRVYPFNDREGNYRVTIIEKRDTGEYQRDTMKFEILGIKPRKGKRWQIGKEKANELEKKKRFIVENGILKLKIYDFEETDSSSAQPTLLDDHGTTDEANKEVNGSLFGGKYRFVNPKPEKLLRHLIDIGSNEDDIVLDFFTGSGTTGATAMKMRRQFILCEQMDYVEKVTVERLKKVVGKQVKKSGKLLEEIDYDNGGISKEVKWNGGGDFIYCELMKYNELFVDKIKKAKDTKELLKIWEEMKARSFLNYNIDIKKFDETIDEFKKLPFTKQQRTLFDLLNKNQLYVNFSEIEDKEFKVGEEDKLLNNKFYG